MTWTGNCTVVEVDGTTVRAVAQADEKVTVRYPGQPEDLAHEVPGVYSNIEGKILRVKLELSFEGQAPPLRVGDVLTVNGSFDAKALQDRAAS